MMGSDSKPEDTPLMWRKRCQEYEGYRADYRVKSGVWETFAQQKILKTKTDDAIDQRANLSPSTRGTDSCWLWTDVNTTAAIKANQDINFRFADKGLSKATSIAPEA